MTVPNIKRWLGSVSPFSIFRTDIRLSEKWLGSVSSFSIFRTDIRLSERWHNNILVYYLKNIKTVTDAVNSLKRIAYEGHDTSDKIMERLSLYIFYLFTK